MPSANTDDGDGDLEEFGLAVAERQPTDDPMAATGHGLPLEQLNMLSGTAPVASPSRSVGRGLTWDQIIELANMK